MNLREKRIAFLGAGSMAEAIIAGMTAKQIVSADRIIATNHSNKERLTELENKYGIRTSQSKKDVVSQSDIIILAMKPKDIQPAITEIKQYLSESKIVVSLLAGISTRYMEQLIGLRNAVVRVMPNTSAMIGQSATTITAGRYATISTVGLIKQLMTSIGTTTLIEEEQMDAYTALAGSAPAFYYYMVEAMEKFVEEQGLHKETAMPLMAQTIKGVAEMLATTSEAPATLRKKITSPGGTTEAGLKTLAQHEFQQAVIACLEQTTKRSKELREMFEK
ncbi:pyrroline-5-carboxylate reductase [Gracilibacillus thailandensis]|uniref:Pyrroline-5-carboxylate reductase n=2 Tax=Gracilibacillus thailandensis TaxID=563735 RepID=A0A6N7R011_9BACI|nr:pyrroline-5-carboxylate reductase [Gracilibacillus thailandensis]MRI67733.1 pyrroline-5-carboxylate reductase [Gracilibacillus thailandensis]